MAEKKKRKKWGDEDMVSAMNAVEKKEMTIYSAAARFSVPRKTLDDRMKGHVKHGTNPGPRTVFTPEQDEALVSYLFSMADHGYSLTQTMVKAYGWPLLRGLVTGTILIRNLGLVSIGGLISERGIQMSLFVEQTCWSVPGLKFLTRILLKSILVS